MCVVVWMDGYICVLFVLLGQVGRSVPVGSELYLIAAHLSPSPFSFLSFFFFPRTHKMYT